MFMCKYLLKSFFLIFYLPALCPRPDVPLSHDGTHMTPPSKRNQTTITHMWWQVAEWEKCCGLCLVHLLLIWSQQIRQAHHNFFSRWLGWGKHPWRDVLLNPIMQHSHSDYEPDITGTVSVRHTFNILICFILLFSIYCLVHHTIVILSIRFCFCSCTTKFGYIKK